MRTASAKPGDIVRADVKGRRFHAYVVERNGQSMTVQPIESNISYRSLTTRQVIGVWGQRAGSKPGVLL
jgi:SOS-response transcriptional repressor LexA